MAENGSAVDRLVLETDDVETGHDLLRQLYADHTPRLSGDVENYRFRYAVNTLGGLGVDHMKHSLLMHLDLEPYHLLGAFTLDAGRLTVSAGGVTEQIAPGDVVLIDPLRPVSVEMEDLELAPVRLDLAATCELAEEITGMPAAEVSFHLSRPLSEAHARRWQAAVNHVSRDVLAHDEIARIPLVRAESFRFLATTLLTSFPNTALGACLERRAPGSWAEPAVIRRAVEFMDANAQHDIDLTRIADAARVGPRALQMAFRRHRGQTPMEYLRQVRMAGVHRDLEGADPAGGDTVSGVAARWGFTHPGRFSVEYRRAYGRSPRETLRG